jgi:hypothetical protein
MYMFETQLCILIRLRWSLSKWYSIQKLSNILRKYVKKSKQEDQIVEDV